MIRPLRPLLAGLALLTFITNRSEAAFQVGVSFDDPQQAYTAYYSPIIANLQAAGADWARHVAGSGTINIEVDFGNIATSEGRSGASAFVGSDATYNYFEQGSAYKIRTGIDVNGPLPDAYITIGTNFLSNDLWFDPNPVARDMAQPSDKIDAYSVMLHELGHVLAFNGWRNSQTGEPPAYYMSPFDALVKRDNGGFSFTGSLATSLYGGPVPLSSNNLFHLGNTFPGAGSDLLGDLMNGVNIARGVRYNLSPLDIAIAGDVGLNVLPVPEPGSVVLLALGGLIVGMRARLRSRRLRD